jgi:hypothetical protein
MHSISCKPDGHIAHHRDPAFCEGRVGNERRASCVAYEENHVEPLWATRIVDAREHDTKFLIGVFRFFVSIVDKLPTLFGCPWSTLAVSTS